MSSTLHPTTQSEDRRHDLMPRENARLTQDSKATEEGRLEKQDAGRSTTNRSIFSRTYMTGPVEKDHTDLALLACSLVTGMVDASSFRNYGMFVGMQTGNTVILGLTAAGLPQNPHAWLTTLISIASFLVGPAHSAICRPGAASRPDPAESLTLQSHPTRSYLRHRQHPHRRAHPTTRLPERHTDRHLAHPRLQRTARQRPDEHILRHHGRFQPSGVEQRAAQPACRSRTAVARGRDRIWLVAAQLRGLGSGAVAVGRDQIPDRRGHVLLLAACYGEGRACMIDIGHYAACIYWSGRPALCVPQSSWPATVMYMYAFRFVGSTCSLRGRVYVKGKAAAVAQHSDHSLTCYLYSAVLRCGGTMLEILVPDYTSEPQVDEPAI
nr:hypothetical protein CFP56_03051 [Quercus suber]